MTDPIKIPAVAKEIIKHKRTGKVYDTKADFDAWLAIAKKTSYKNFAEKVPGGQKLIDQALAVK